MPGGNGTEDGRGRRRHRSRRNRGRSSSERQSQSQTAKASGSTESSRKRGRGGQGRKAAAVDKRQLPSTSNTPCLGASRYFTGELNEFELFCAYHLGIEGDGTYRPPKLSDVARRFKTDDAAILEALRGFQMDRDHVRASGFDVGLAKLDIEVAPAGIDRVELARSIFQEFLDAGCGIGPVPMIAIEGPPAIDKASTESDPD